jgi:hypothetical protein
VTLTFSVSERASAALVMQQTMIALADSPHNLNLPELEAISTHMFKVDDGE